MPQFDAAFYCSQFFWLIVCLSVLVFLFKKVFIPRMNTILNNRKTYIDRYNFETSSIKTQIKSIDEEIKRKKNDSIAEYNRIVKRAKQKANESYDNKFKAIQLENEKLINSTISALYEEKKHIRSLLNQDTDKMSDLIFEKLFK